MKRCRRQHEAERSETRRDGLCQLLWSVGVKEDDGSLRCGELALLLAADRAVAPDELQVARHERERLCFAPFAMAQSTDRFGAGGIASEVIAADPLDCDDRAAADEICGKRDSVDRAVACWCRRSERDQ